MHLLKTIVLAITELQASPPFNTLSTINLLPDNGPPITLTLTSSGLYRQQHTVLLYTDKGQVTHIDTVNSQYTDPILTCFYNAQYIALSCNQQGLWVPSVNSRGNLTDRVSNQRALATLQAVSELARVFLTQKLKQENNTC